MNGGTFAGVEYTELDPGRVDTRGHFSPERVDLPNQLAFTDPANSRVAGHEGNRVQTDRDQERSATHPRRGQGCLASSVSCPDHYHVVNVFPNSHKFYTYVKSAEKLVQHLFGRTFPGDFFQCLHGVLPFGFAWVAEVVATVNF